MVEALESYRKRLDAIDAETGNTNDNLFDAGRAIQSAISDLGHYLADLTMEGK